jgi:carboxypeptidase family protein/TonB-dependent receptor-like protein
MKRSLLALVALPLLAASLAAQSTPTGRLEGTITDSVHARPLVGASVLAVRVDPQPSVSAGATTDARGRFRLDTLPAGKYLVEFASPFLDSLEITLPPREVTIAAGGSARVDFGLPSGRTLRAAACPGVELPRETGAIVGRVLDADTDRPLAGANVVTSWSELAIDRATMRPSYEQRSGAVATDSLGQYRLCGVPTDNWIVVQVQRDGRTGSPLRLQVPDSAGVVVRALSMSSESSRPIAADSGARSDSAAPPMLSGSASVAGVVRGVGGLPLAGAQLRVLGAASVARADAQGRYSLGDLPNGSQVLEVRHIGYLLAQQPVELRSGRTITQDVRLQRIVTLDSIRVLAQRSRYRDFEEHRKRSGFGRFLDADQIASQRAFELSDVIRIIPGFRVSGFGIDAKVTSSRGMTSMSGPCEVNIVMDGIQHQDINLIHPSSVGAIEAYPAGGPPGPLEYDGRCGMIVIWSRR